MEGINKPEIILFFYMLHRAAIHVLQGGHKTILICQKMYTHTKLTYFDHPNKNIDHPNLRITRILIQ